LLSEAAAAFLVCCWIPCALQSLTTPHRGCHYCSNCGLRLAWCNGQFTWALVQPSVVDDATYDYTQPPQEPPPDDDDDRGALPAYAATADMAAFRSARGALSPLGPPSGDRPATFGKMSMAELHRLRPTRILRIAWNPETWVPTSIYDDDGTTKLFAVTMPAFAQRAEQANNSSLDSKPPRVVRDFLPFQGGPMYDRQKHEKQWDPSKPHIRLAGFADTDPPLEWEVATARMYSGGWETQIFTPSPIADSTLPTTPTLPRHQVPNVTVHVEVAANEFTWRSPASIGQLTWRWPGTTSMSCYGHIRVLFDVYERPVAAHIDSYPAGTHAKNTAPSLPSPGRILGGGTAATDRVIEAPTEFNPVDGRHAKGSLTRLALYADLSEELLAELLIGFAVLCAQARRFDVIPRD
jgi:hypothetical protein